LIAINEPDLVEIWSKIKEKSQLTKLSTFLESEDRVARGFEMTLEGLSPVSAYTTVLMRDVGRALKKHDQWIVASIPKEHVIAENKFTHETITIRCEGSPVLRHSMFQTLLI